jgi:hypothetical protein
MHITRPGGFMSWILMTFLIVSSTSAGCEQPIAAPTYRGAATVAHA